MEPIRLNKESVSLDKLEQICEQEPGERISFYKIYAQHLAKTDERPKSEQHAPVYTETQGTSSYFRDHIHVCRMMQTRAIEHQDEIKRKLLYLDVKERHESNQGIGAHNRISHGSWDMYVDINNNSSFKLSYASRTETPPHKTGVPMEWLDELERELEVKKRHENNQNPQRNS